MEEERQGGIDKTGKRRDEFSKWVKKSIKYKSIIKTTY